MRQPARLLSALFLIALSTFTALASGPTFWVSATAADFLKGTSDGVVVSLEGVLSLGPALTNRLTSAPAQIWSVADGGDGTLWAGTGGDGRVIRIRPGAPEETVFDAEETHVFALAVSGTRVYAATSPDGRVYVIDGAAAPRPFFDPTEKYIWALAVDATGRVWIGAGSPGVIYRVEANGTGGAIYRPAAAHVVSLARDAQGQMLAGTESPGRLYRIGAGDRAFALLDTGLTELRAIAAQADGSIVAAAMTRGDEPAAAGADTAVVTSVATAATPPQAAATSAAASATPPSRRSVLFRIAPSGMWETIWETTDLIYDLTTTSEGHVLIATGPEGRLYRIEGGREALLLTGVDARQITRFAASARSGTAVPAFATANPGRLMVPATGAAATPTATFTSSVRDSRSLATWGQIRWEGTGAVSLQTRSGNTERPDDSWSDWSPVYTRREGEAIQSPAARFLQWRATFPRATAGAPAAVGASPAAAPRLTSVTVAYLPRNARPVVTAITVHPPGVVFQRPFSSEEGAIAGLDDVTADARRPPGDAPQPSTPGRRMFQKGLQTFAWKAEDADGDRLNYTVEYRREGDTGWRTLRTGLLDPLLVWDTTSVADGRYVIRVRASDHPANSAERALTGDRESDAVDVDNTPPVVTLEITRSAAGVRVVAQARDAHSPIQKLEYSLGGAWQLVYPADGLADAPAERYEFSLPADADVARLIVRATDLLQNVGTVAGR